MQEWLERIRRPAKWAGYPLFGVFAFLGSLYVSLPRERIQDLLETNASAWIGAKVKADDFGLTLITGPGVTASQVTATTQPAAPNEKPQTFTANDVTIHFNVVALMRGFADTTWSGRVAGGSVNGRYKSVPDEGVLSADIADVAVGRVPVISAPGGVPLDGKLTVKADLNAPKNLMAQANGSIAFTLDEATLGDGKAQVAVPGMGEGLTIPKIAIGKLAGTISVEKGKATLHDVRAHSKDLEVELDGYLELRDPISLSVVHAYLKVKPSDALLKRDPKIEGMVMMGGAVARRNDGFYGFTITGVLSSLAALPAKEPPFGVTGVARAPGVPTPAPMPAVHVGPPTAGVTTPPLPPPPAAPPPTVIDVPPAPMPPPPAPPSSAEPGGPTTGPTQIAPPNAIPPSARIGGAGTSPGLRGIIDQVQHGSPEGQDTPEGQQPPPEQPNVQ